MQFCQFGFAQMSQRGRKPRIPHELRHFKDMQTMKIAARRVKPVAQTDKSQKIAFGAVNRAIDSPGVVQTAVGSLQQRLRRNLDPA